MKKSITIVLSLFVFFSCNSNSSEQYQIDGTLKNSQIKTIKLEQLSLKNITTVDSANIDAQGGFTMKGISEKGFYRLKLNDQTFWLFLLEPAKFKAEIDLTAAEPFKISGTEENEEFQKGIKALNDVQREFQQAKMIYMYYQQSGVTGDSMMRATNAVNEAAQKIETIALDGAKNAKSPLVAMFFITNTPLDRHPKENLAVIEKMEKEIPNSSYTKDFRNIYSEYEKQAQAQMNQPKAEDVSVGKMAPEIDLKNPEGKSIKLSSLRGKVVLIDFWASWCGPCRMEMPNVVAAYKKYKDKGFTVYSVSLDKDGNAWKNSIKNLGMVWENHVSDLKWWQCEAAIRYNVQGIPAAFLVDRTGKIVANTELRGEALEQKLLELLQ